MKDTGKYNELGTRINELQPTKIILGCPDTVEMTDKGGKMNNDMKCPVCNVGYVHESVNHWCCDYEFCPSYDETDTETYDILIRTRKALEYTREGFDAAREAALLFCKRTDIAMCALAKISKQHPGSCNKEWYVAVARDALEQITALEQKDK